MTEPRFASPDDRAFYEQLMKALPEEERKVFLQTHRERTSKLKDFRKSQVAAGNWRKKRKFYMDRIKKWHKSFDGRKLHRSLGRLNATRITSRDESLHGFDEFYVTKLLSSLVTHLAIECGYFRPDPHDHVESLLLYEEVAPRLIDMLRRVSVLGERLTLEDHEVLHDLTTPCAFYSALAESIGKETEQVERALSNVVTKYLAENGEPPPLSAFMSVTAALSDLNESQGIRPETGEIFCLIDGGGDNAPASP